MTATLEPSRTEAKGGTKVTPADVIRRAREAGVQIVDVKFCDLPGTWQHFSLPLKELTEDVFADGLGFDGSSIRSRVNATRAIRASWRKRPRATS